MPLADTSRADLDRIAREFKSKPFIPARVFTQGDLQTLGAYFWPGRFRPRDVTGDEERLFDVDQDTRLLARCRWHPNRNDHATLLIWHGMEGSTASSQDRKSTRLNSSHSQISYAV